MVNPFGLVPIAFGLYAILFNRWLARTAINQQNALWGFHFGQRELKGTRISFIFVGIGFIVAGFLIFINVIHLRQ